MEIKAQKMPNSLFAKIKYKTNVLFMIYVFCSHYVFIIIIIIHMIIVKTNLLDSTQFLCIQ